MTQGHRPTGAVTETLAEPALTQDPLEILPAEPIEGLSLEEEIRAEAAVVSRPPPGIFISFEGGEGAGKSTQIARLAAWLQLQGRPVLSTSEPGGTPLGKSLRTLLLRSDDSPRSPLVELFLLLADRAQHVSEVLEPSLKEGLIVLCDRYNDSTVAYQVAGGGLDEAAVRETCLLATSGLTPDLTVLLDIEPVMGLKRIGDDLDKMEVRGLAFHNRVRQAFLDLARAESHRFVTIDGSQPEESVQEQIQAAVLAVLPPPT